MLQDDLPKLPEIEKSLAIFCVATYGEGDPTDNAQELYDWLQDGNSSLEGLNYAVSVARFSPISRTPDGILCFFRFLRPPKGLKKILLRKVY